jgi:hypothetical protein
MLLVPTAAARTFLARREVTPVPQDPAIIQRQIEETRAELADTIDAITDLVHPRRVAERAAAQARARIAELRARVGHPGPARAELTGEPAGAAAPAVPAASPATHTVVRWGRVAAVAGVTMLLVVRTTRRRRRRRR